MDCQKCGFKVNEYDTFCHNCGTRIEKKQSNTYSLICRNCGGIMDVDKERSLLYCPFCKAKEYINDPDGITIERIKSETYKEVERQKCNRDIEMKKMENEKERIKSRGCLTVLGIMALIMFSPFLFFVGMIGIEYLPLILILLIILCLVRRR